nr:NAD(P)H-dependent oxidoreductase [Lacticaseibacillus yichunensis]
MMAHIGIIVGSLRHASFTKKVAQTFAKLAPADLDPVLIPIGDLPLYNEDAEVPTPPASWTAFREAVAEVDGVWFFTPEYNRGLPAALKNALDVASRPYGKNVWAGKPALVVSVSPGAIGGFGANMQLRQSLTFLDMPVLQQPEAYIGGISKLLTEDGIVQGTQDYFALIIEKYADFYRQLKK